MLGRYKILRNGKLEEVNITTSISAVEGLSAQLADKISLSKDTVINASHTYKNPLIIDGQNNYIDIGRKNNWFWTRFSGENWTFNNTYTGGGWARNLMEMKDAQGNAYFRIGAQGSSQNFTQMYIGPSYNNYWLSLNSSRVLFGTKPQYAGNPTSNDDLTRKAYVDSQINNITTNYAKKTELDSYLKRDGSTPMTGNLNMSGKNITSVKSIMLKNGILPHYLEADDTRLSLGVIGLKSYYFYIDRFDLADSRITNVKDPSDPQDAANKQWVENYVANSGKLKTKYAYTWFKGDGLTPLQTSHNISTLINNGEFPLLVTVDVGIDDTGTGSPQTTLSRGSVSFTISSVYTGGVWDFKGDTPGGTVEFNHWGIENSINLILTQMGKEYYTFVEVKVYGY